MELELTTTQADLTAVCPACHEQRITYPHAGRRRIRAHSNGRADVYAPTRGADCPGSHQPVTGAGA